MHPAYSNLRASLFLALTWCTASLDCAAETAKTSPADSAHAVSLHLLCWSEYVPQTIVEGFQRSAGVPVVIENYASNEQLLEKLRARPGFYDLIQPSTYYVKTLAANGELEPLDFTHLPNARHLDPEYHSLERGSTEARFSVPWLAGTVGIVVNTERIREPVTTWADVFSGRYAGRLVIVDDPREMVTWALATLGLPLTDVSDAALAKVEPLLRQWLPQVKVFDSDSPKSALLDGRADLGIVWSGEAALLWQRSRKFQFVLPAAGAHKFLDSLAIPKDAPHKAVAEAFIDYCLTPEISVLISDAFPYTNPNLAARRLLTPEQLANPASYPPRLSTLPTLHNEGNTPAAITAFIQKLR